jgi:septation ring formation regulator EzrA
MLRIGFFNFGVFVMSGEKRDIKEAIFSELFEDMHQVVKVIEQVHHEQKNLRDEFGGIINDAANETANQIADALKADLEKSSRVLETSAKEFTSLITKLERMGGTIQKHTKTIENNSKNIHLKYAALGVFIFVFTSIVNFALFHYFLQSH